MKAGGGDSPPPPPSPSLPPSLPPLLPLVWRGLQESPRRAEAGLWGERSRAVESGGRPRSLAMGKDQELLEAARTGNVALVEKLLSGRKGGILGSGSGAIPLSSLLR